MDQMHSKNRFPVMEGGCNFRDLGGYRTTDGRRVRQRVLYRSGAMDRMSDRDYAKLGALGLRAICDFRSSSERSRAPTAWQSVKGLTYWCRDYDHSVGDLNRLLVSKSVSLRDARSVMKDIYRRLPAEQEEAYRHLFRSLANGHLPLVFNCSAGKDRTGLAAALILTVLGVPFETVLEDYELSNTAFDYRQQARGNGLKLSDEVVEALGGTQPDYLLAAWTTLREEHGSAELYVQEHLGITKPELEEIRSLLLE